MKCFYVSFEGEITGKHFTTLWTWFHQLGLSVFAGQVSVQCVFVGEPRSTERTILTVNSLVTQQVRFQALFCLEFLTANSTAVPCRVVVSSQDLKPEV